MSHEQNISDILRSLKADVDRMPVDVEREVVFDPEIADISDEMLKSRLKAQFQTKDTVSTLDSSEDYALDEALLEEFSEFEEESDELVYRLHLCGLISHLFRLIIQPLYCPCVNICIA